MSGGVGSLATAGGRKFTRPVSRLPVSATWEWRRKANRCGTGRVDTGGVSGIIHTHNNDKGKHNAEETKNRRLVRQGSQFQLRNSAVEGSPQTTVHHHS